MFIEPDAGIAYYDEKGIMTVIASTQNPHYDRNEVAGMLGVPQNHVRCIQPTTGGGFGGKLDIGVQLHCALLAHYTKRPVKIVRSRTESTMISSKRHPITTHVKTGATKDGKLVAAQYELTCDAGAYGSAVVHEGQMDALAAALHMSPLEIRRINGHHVGSTIPTGQTLTESVGYQDTLAEAIKKAEEVMPDALERLDPDWRPQI